MKRIIGLIAAIIYACTLISCLSGLEYAYNVKKESGDNNKTVGTVHGENPQGISGAEIFVRRNPPNIASTYEKGHKPEIIHNISQIENCLFCLIEEKYKCVFDELQNVSIKVVKFDTVFLDSGFYTFFTVRPTWTSLLFPFSKCRYRLGVNHRALKAGIPFDALHGALSHELVHIVFYEKRGFIEFLRACWVEIAKGRSEELQEKEIDREVIRRKMGRELIAFRLWLYEQLDAQNLTRKKRVYLTPEEITAQMQQ